MKLSKALSIVFVLIICLSFVCCKNAASQTVASKQSFSCKIALNYNGIDVKGDVIHHAPGLCTVKLTEPETLSSMEIDWEGGSFKVKYLGMSITLSEDSFPEAAFVPVVLDAMDKLSTAGEMLLIPDETGEKCIYEGQCSQGTFRAMIDNETGAVYMIEIPDYGIYITVTDFQGLSKE